MKQEPRTRTGRRARTAREPGAAWSHVVLGAAMFALLICASAAGVQAQEGIEAGIRTRVERPEAGGAIRIGGAEVRRSAVLVELYRRSGYRPIWDDVGGGALVDAIRGVALDGLDPADYHLRAIESLQADRRADAAADLDILRSDALVRMVNDLRYGKLDPDDPGSGRRLRLGSADAPALARMARSGQLPIELAALRPDRPIYRGLVDALAALRLVEERGGWEVLPAGPALRIGVVSPRVGALRRRLSAEPGPFPVPPATRSPDSFDLDLEGAVRAAQRRYGLNEDGVVGPATLAQLNVPIAARIGTIRVNLERARWSAHDLPPTFVAVNIAGTRVYFVRDGEPIYESRAIVGRSSTRTPIFQAAMTHIELNPTWTVPPGIVSEVIADIRRDPGYLGRVGMDVIDSGGRPVSIAHDDLIRFTAATFPYVFRQRPGPLNPLGQIKFVFPNPYNVYLHDTPSRGLFEQEERMFSHGCIRLQNPIGLAELILNDPARWSRSQLEDAIAVGRTRVITLASPIPVVILYWTASNTLGGELHLFRDIYDWDSAVLRGLDR